MEPLSHPSRTFRELVEADLRRATRLIIKIPDELAWQFRLAAPAGDHYLSLMMPTAARERQQMHRQVTTFLASKRSTAFCLAVETTTPDAVCAVGIARRERCHGLARILREPNPWTAANFSPVEWLPEQAIDPEIAALLPTGPRPLTPKEISALQTWFGVDGRFPAVPIPTVDVRACDISGA